MFSDPTDQLNPWNWPKYNPPGLLIGPLPWIKRYLGTGTQFMWVPDYSHPGVAERIRVEVDFNEDMAYDKHKGRV